MKNGLLIGSLALLVACSSNGSSSGNGGTSASGGTNATGGTASGSGGTSSGSGGTSSGSGGTGGKGGALNGFPGQPGNPVGYATHAPLGTTPWTGGTFKSGTAGSPTSYQGYVITGGVSISGQYITFTSCDFKSGTGGVAVSGSNIKFVGCRFQSNSTQDYNVQTTGGDLTFSYDSFTPLASFYTSPPGAAWPSASASANTTQQTPDVNAINGNDGYEYGLNVVSGGPITVDHCDFWGFGNAIPMYATTAQITITSNWIHDAADSGPQSYHTDGPGYLNGGTAPSNVLIRGNTIASLGNTNGIAFQAATSGYDNIQITGNYLSGFGYLAALSLPGSAHFTHSSFKNNVIGTDVSWVYGPIYSDATSIFQTTGNTWSGNTFHVAPGSNDSASSVGGNYHWTAANQGNFVWPDGSLNTTDFIP